MTLDLNKAKSGGTFTRAEDGSYPARFVQVIDLGVQPQEDYQTGEAKEPKPRVLLTFEFPTERIEVNGEDRPRWYSKEYTISNHEKAGILKVVKSLDPSGKEMQLSKLLGKPCLITIGSTSTGKPKIVSIAPPMKGMEVGELENPPVAFDFDNPDVGLFNSLPDWLKEKIRGALNFEGSPLKDMLENFNDDIPF